MNAQRIITAFAQPASVRLETLPPLALYVHVPWCVRKCPYCDFNSHALRDGALDPALEAAYIAALRADLERALPQVWGRPVHTVFIGGGTPSLLSAPGLDRLLCDIRALLPLDADAEITLEANPGTAEAAKFAQFRLSGINRLSVGVQSFNDAHLRALGRIHDAQEARAAIDLAMRTFDNVNLDLMFALPQQTLAQCQADIETALGFAPQHLSLYQLTLEPHTPFAKRPPALPDDDTAADMQDWIHTRAAAAGYGHYEVSAWAKPRQQCRHNLNYWHFGDYLGIGAGAHAKLSFPDRIVRQVRYSSPLAFIEHARAGNAASEEHSVRMEDLPFEFMLNALRLVNGFAHHEFSERTGLPVASIDAALSGAERRGLIARDPLKIVPTAQGQRFLNDLQMLFLAA